MALTAPLIDTALIVVDIQRGTAKNPFITAFDDVAAHAAELAAAFRRRGAPVVIATFALSRPAADGQPDRPEPEGFREPLGVLDVHPDDLTVTRPAWSAFSGTGLDRMLCDHGITRLVLAGVATSIGVESTAREARDLGYELVIASDAVTDLRAETHENSIQRIFPMMAEIATTDEILSALGV
ncbi:isochorismatase family protein [Microbacterium sp. SS28]|uniref:isochorismatase family protein n=1 Tax=Microbacterium sp. SS28 TaxID=2919948 RepID=UPI001FA98D5B|nr:isochorismatase family protein [Microbacterium sp. SS28]